MEHAPDVELEVQHSASVEDQQLDLPQQQAGVASTYQTADDFLKMDSAEFRRLLQNEEIPLTYFIRLQQKAGMAPPSASLAFRNLYYVKQNKVLVNGVSGYLRPGSMVCVIGAPGAGIGNMFNVLAQREQGGRVTGEMMVNNQPPSDAHRRTVGLIPKDDIHLPTLTVRETIEFSASMRCNLHTDIDVARKHLRMRVDVVLALLGLSHVADSVVGGDLLRGISGGEKRRLSIGAELLGHSIFLMEEPTNGLDSAAAYDVMKSCKKIAQCGYAVMASLVQPSQELYELFDSVMLLSYGRCVYFGPREEAMPYLASLGFEKPMFKSDPNFFEELTGNPEVFCKDEIKCTGLAKSYMSSKFYDEVGRVLWHEMQVQLTQEEEHWESAQQVAILDKKKKKKKKRKKQQPQKDAQTQRRTSLKGSTVVPEHKGSDVDLEHGAQASHDQGGGIQHHEPVNGHGDHHDHDTHLFDEPESSLEPIGAAGTKHIAAFESAYAIATWRQILICTLRMWKVTIRNPKVVMVRFIQPIFVGLLLGSTFTNMAKTPAGAQDRFGFLFYVLAFMGFGGIPVVPVLFNLKAVFLRQKEANMYRPSAFYASLVLTNIPFAVAEVFIMSLIAYPMCGLNDGLFSNRYGYFWLTLWATNLTAWTYCLLCAILSPSAEVAQAIAPVSMAVFFVFNGFLAPKRSIPDPWIWMHYLSMFTHSFKGLALNENKSLTFFCSETDKVPPLNAGGQWASLPNMNRQCPVRNGDDILNMYDMNSDAESDKWLLMLYQWLFYIVFNIFVYLALVWLHSKSQDVLIPKRKERMETQLKPVQEMDGSKCAYLTFKNLSYSVYESNPKASRKDVLLRKPEAKRVKQLLNDVTAYVEPGKLIALMGSSGAGKTTLLDVLAGRKTEGVTTGQLLINGHPRNEFFPRISGYVEQFNALEATQTIREAVKFSADLRLANLSDEDKNKRVDSVLEELGMSTISDITIGRPEEGGIPLDLAKKVTIAQELVADPQILFLDEPTTGLAAAGAWAVMDTIKKLSEAGGRTIICTIHQPAQDIFRMFDWLLLLNKGPKGGEIVYFGAINDLESYLESVGLGTCPPDRNLADYVIEAVGAGISKRNLDRPAVNVREEYLKSPLHLEAERKLADLSTGEIVPVNVVHPVFNSVYASSLWHQYQVCTVRFFMSFWRNKPTLITRFASATIMALILGTLYWQTANNQTGAYNRIAFVFVSILYASYTAMLSIPSIVKQRPIFYRERSARAYGVFPYYMARVSGESLFLIVQTLLFVIIAYWMAGLNSDSGSFFTFLLGFWFVNTLVSSFSQLIAGISPDGEIGTVLNTFMLAFVVLFGGFVVVRDSLPAGWIWMYYLSFFRYPLFMLTANTMHGVTFNCGDGTQGAVPIPLFDLTNPTLQAVCMPNNVPNLADSTCFNFFCPITSGDQMLQRFFIDYDDIWTYFGAMVCFLFGFRVLVILVLKKVSFEKR